MQPINTVSETALLTLRSRVVESDRENPVLMDPVGKECFQRLMEILPNDLRDRIMNRKLSSFLSRHLALRARKYDEFCLEFLTEHPDGVVVNLGAGFDTRFWRIGVDKNRYMELDLPEVIELKREILGDKISYETFGRSVLDPDWINTLKAKQSEYILFLAEGLFMYFPPEDSKRTLQSMAENFAKSRLVMEVVHEKYTRGTYKKMVERKMRRRAGTEAGDYFLFGISRGSDLELLHPDYHLRREWSFFEDPDVKPSMLRFLRNMRSIAKSQYTVIADIG